MQKYPHIIELPSCIRKMLAFIFLFYEAEDEGRLTKSLIYSGIYSTPKLLK